VLAKISKHFNLVVYEESKAPRFYKLNKTIIKATLVFIPTALVLAVGLSLYVFSNMQQVVDQIKKREPQIIKQLKQEKFEMMQKQEELIVYTNNLEKKIQAGGSSGEQPLLSLFKRPLGFQDLSAQKTITLASPSVDFNDKETEFSFNIENTDDSKKQTGYIFIVMRNGSNLFLYPKKELSKQEYLYTYNLGETFGVQRFRPTTASFPRVKYDSLLYFDVFIFSRAGDIILNKKLGPFDNPI
jgi:hypothetical protein